MIANVKANFSLNFLCSNWSYFEAKSVALQPQMKSKFKIDIKTFYRCIFLSDILPSYKNTFSVF